MRWQWVVMIALVLGGASSAGAFHVCATLNDALPAVPRVGSDGTRAAKVTAKLRERIAEGKHLPPGQLRKVLGPDLAERAREIRWLCREEPDQCYAALLDVTERDALGADPCVEARVTIEGRLVTIIADGEQSATAYELHADDGTVYRLHVAAPIAQQLARHTRARLTADRLGTDLYATQEAVVEDVGPWVEPPVYAIGPVRILLIAAAFADSPVTQTIAALQADAEIVRDFYATVSGGRSQPTVTVWPTVVTVQTPTTCSPGSDHRAVATALGTALDWTPIDVALIVSDYTVCPWAGVAYMGAMLFQGGNRGLALARQWVPGTEIHEIGHTMALNHGTEWLAPSFFVQGGEYGDGVTNTQYRTVATVMGSSYGRNPFGMLARQRLRWHDSADILHEPAPGRYTLVPVGSPGLQALTWQRTANERGAIELREPVTVFDQFESRLKRAGCFVSSSLRATSPYEAQRRLSSRTTQGCEVGETIEDVTGLRARIESVTATAMVVDVVASNTPDLIGPAVGVTTPAWDATVSGVFDVATTLGDAHPYGIIWQLVCPGYSVTRPRLLVPPYADQLDATPCRPGQGYVYARGIDAVGASTLATVPVTIAGGTPTTTVAPSTSTTSSTSTTTSIPAPTTTTTTTRQATTTTVRPTTTTTTLACLARGASCMIGGIKHPERCCSRRCGGARRCR